MNVLEVRNIDKIYKHYSNELKRILSWFNLKSSPDEEYTVLSNVSFNVNKGEAVGIVGENGAGKSTLLKIITGTTRPTCGEVIVNGRISAILELGMGFNGDFTGRQNAINSLGMMGFNPHEIDKFIPMVEEFSEVGEYFDQPMRMYSSGMMIRVAFSVATVVKPDLLIIDEALSVGDAYFQHKSFAKIKEYSEQGTSLLFVSHDKGAVLSLCDRAILLEKGHVIKDGDPEIVCDYYNAMIAEKGNSYVKQTVKENGRTETISGSGEATFESIHLYNMLGEKMDTIKVGEEVELHIKVRVNEDLGNLVLGCGIKDRLGQMMFGTNTEYTKHVVKNPKKNEVYLYKVRFNANLGCGSYSVHCSIVDTEAHMYKNFEWREGTLIFNVINVDKYVFVGSMWNEMFFKISKVS